VHVSSTSVPFRRTSVCTFGFGWCFLDRFRAHRSAAPAHHHQRQHSSCERRNSRLRSSEAQPQAHTPGHYPTDSTPSCNHRSPIAYGNNGLQTKHIDLRLPHIRQAIDAGTIPLSHAAAKDPTVNMLIKPLVCTTLINSGTPCDLRGSVSGNNWSKYARR
jgi:hypothetical protein